MCEGKAKIYFPDGRTVDIKYEKNERVGSSLFTTKKASSYEGEWEAINPTTTPRKPSVEEMKEYLALLKERDKDFKLDPGDDEEETPLTPLTARRPHLSLAFFSMINMTKYVSKEGDVFTGEFKGGKKHGRGIFKYANGRQYIGSFKNGRYSRAHFIP